MVRLSSGDKSSTGMFVETWIEQTKEKVAGEFLEACGHDETKRKLVLELCRKVLNREQYKRVISEERIEEEGKKTEEGEREEEDKFDSNVEKEGNDEGSTDSSIPTMKQIEDRPYTNGISGETGELPFEEFKDLLEPDTDQQENQPEQPSRRGKRSLAPKKDAIKQFGEVDAKKFVNWYHHVKHSGQLYSDEWLEGKIRDMNLGKIKSQMLLMCLQEKRISKALASVLGKICDDLNLLTVVQKALEEWGVADIFRAVWARKPSDQYMDNLKSCRQCEIFVARAYVCISTLKHANVSEDLSNKLLSCFTLMEANLPRDLAKTNVQRKSQGTESGRKNMSVASTHTSTGDAQTQERTIQQVDEKTNDVLDEFSSIEDIIGRIGSQFKDSKEPRRYIVKVLNGEQTTACGYIWRYKQNSKNQGSNTRTKEKSKGSKGADCVDIAEDTQSDTQTTTSNGRLEKTTSIQPEHRDTSSGLKGTKASTTLTLHHTHHSASSDNGSDHIIERMNPNTGEVVGEFSSVEDVVSKLQFESPNPRTYIYGVLRGAQQTFEGNIWRYKEQTKTIKPGSSARDGGDGRIDELPTEEQHRGKRKSCYNDLEESASKRTRLDVGDTDGQTTHSNVSGNQASIEGMQNVRGNVSSLASTMRAISAIDHIKESPYLKEGNAEVGEAMFDSFKDLLVSRGSGRHIDASFEAKQKFGEKRAIELVNANDAIAKSGMVYGTDWKNGNIQGKKCRLESLHLLLLCLQEQRLASSYTSQLSIVICELGVVDIVKEAVQAWKLESDFPLLLGMKNAAALHSKTKALLGCLIFVARSYRCMKALKQNKVSDSIMRKVRQCLALLHNSLEHKQAKDTALERNSALKMGDKPVGQRQKASLHVRTSKVGKSVFSEEKGGPEPVNPGFIMHNLFLKPSRVSEAPPKNKTKQTTEPNGASNSNPSTTSSASSTANEMDRVERMNIDCVQKQTPSQPAQKNPPAKQQMQSEATSKNPQNAEQTQQNKPSQDGWLPTNQQKQISAPTKVQNTNKPSPRKTHTADLRTSASMGEGSSSPPNPSQSPINEIPLPDFIPPIGNWFPPEKMLSDTETELAWLSCECAFALRLAPSDDPDPQFIWKYASPSLKMKLREISGETKLKRLVRLKDGYVRKSFELLQENINKTLNKGSRRIHMEQVIRVLRKKSRLANQRRSVVV